MGTLGYCIYSAGHNKSMKFGVDIVDNMGIHHTKFQLCPATTATTAQSCSCVATTAQSFAFLHTEG